MSRRLDELPLPVATSVAKAELAKSPRDRHDHAFWAWDLSVRLRYFSHGFRHIAERPSLGLWVQEQSWPRLASLSDPSLVEVARLFARQAGREVGAGPLSPARLVEWLATYRNEVLGHSTPRSHAFCRAAADVLLTGLEAAWRDGVFLSRGTRLLVRHTTDDGERRTLSLMGPVPHPVEAPEASLADDVVYLMGDGGPISMDPALLFRDDGPRPTLLFYDGGEHRRAVYRDFDASGGASRQVDVVTHTPTPGSVTTAAPPSSGDSNDGYEVLGVLGEGGMGVVQLARSRVLGGLVALKRVRQNAEEGPRTRRRFEKEVDALRACSHPNVVRLVDAGTDGGGSYLAMEFVEGPSLAQIAAHATLQASFGASVRAAWIHVRDANPALSQHTAPMSAPEASSEPRWVGVVSALATAAGALADLHDKGVLHRDISPGNILLVAADGRVVLADFGLATRAEDDGGSTTSQALGTRQYAAPERQLGAPASAQADQYSLVASFLDVLCDPATLAKHRLRGLETLSLRAACPTMPAQVELAILRALARDPAGRHESARALARALLKGGPDGGPRESKPNLGRGAKRRWALATAAALAMAGVFWWRSANREATAPKLAAEDVSVVDHRNGWEWSDRCWKHYNYGRADEAEAACQQGLLIAPEDPKGARPSLLYNLGLLAMKRSDLAAARQQFARSLSRRPHPEVWAKLADVCARAGLVAGVDERIRVASWERDTQTSAVRDRPSLTGTGLDSLPIGTCLATGEVSSGGSEVWVRVRYLSGNTQRTGWMHEAVLAPRPTDTGELAAIAP